MVGNRLERAGVPRRGATAGVGGRASRIQRKYSHPDPSSCHRANATFRCALVTHLIAVARTEVRLREPAPRDRHPRANVVAIPPRVHCIRRCLHVGIAAGCNRRNCLPPARARRRCRQRPQRRQHRDKQARPRARRHPDGPKSKMCSARRGSPFTHTKSNNRETIVQWDPMEAQYMYIYGVIRYKTKKRGRMPQERKSLSLSLSLSMRICVCVHLCMYAETGKQSDYAPRTSRKLLLGSSLVTSSGEALSSSAPPPPPSGWS